MKRLLFFIIASISFHSPILSEGCISFLESQRFYKNKHVGNIYFLYKYTFRDLDPKYINGMRFDSMSDHEIYEYRETNSDPWTYCKLSPKSEKPNVRPIGSCNGKPFFSGDPIWNMNYNFIYDKNGNKWSVFNPDNSQNNFYRKDVSECYFDSEKGLYYETVEENFDLLVPQADKQLWMKLKGYSYYKKGIKPSF